MVRLRQTPNGADRSALTFYQLKLVTQYYGACARIKRHNHNKQDDLLLKRKFIRADWSKQVHISLLVFCIENYWLSCLSSHGDAQHLCQRSFYFKLAEQLIDNSWNNDISPSHVSSGDYVGDIYRNTESNQSYTYKQALA